MADLAKGHGPLSPAQKAKKAEIESKITPGGGFLRSDLAAWGVPWPPPKGWKKRLIREAGKIVTIDEAGPVDKKVWEK